MLIHLIDITGKDPVDAMAIVEDELEAYGEGLEEKPRLIVLNKVDQADPELIKAFSAELKAAGARRVFAVSGATGKGMGMLLDAVIKHLPAATVTERPEGEAEEAGDIAQWSPLG